MNPTQILMSASALVLGLLGVLGTFAPDLVLRRIAAPETPLLELMVQVVGALYFGFAMLNWMSRESLIGGIYARPTVVGNLVHFLTAGLAMLRVAATAPDLAGLWILTLVYAAFAVGFGTLLFRHPLPPPA